MKLHSPVKLYSKEKIEFPFASGFKSVLVQSSLNVPCYTLLQRSLKIKYSLIL